MRFSFVATALAAAATLVAPQSADETPHYFGGAAQISVTGQSFDVTTGDVVAEMEIGGFVVVGAGVEAGGGGLSGITLTRIVVKVAGSDRGARFKVDDDNDGAVRGPAERDDVDALHHAEDELRTISDDASMCIRKGETFSLVASGSSVNPVGTLHWQAVAKSTANRPNGVGGALIGALTPVAGDAVAVARIQNRFNSKGVALCGRNDGTAAVTGVTVTPPSGVHIVNATSRANPGNFDAKTRTFTYATPIAIGARFELQVTVDGLDDGMQTNLQWSAKD